MTLKTFLKRAFFQLLGLGGLALIFPGFQVSAGLKTFVIGAIVLTIINIFITPIIKLLLLPINLLTIGMFRWVSNTVSLFLLTVLVEQLNFTSFTSSGASWAGFVIPQIHFSYLASLITGSFILSFILSFMKWLI